MIASSSWSTLVKLLRRSRFSVSSRNQRLIRFSRELLVGVKWIWKRLWRDSHFFTSGCLCVA